jgi:predicted GH43/DUF377 family glycosyl hydrolase
MHDMHLYGLATFALKRGGKLYPITIPKELTRETGIMNPSIYVYKGRILMNIRHVNYTLYHSEGKKFPHQFGPLAYIHPENDVTLTTYNIMCELDGNMNVISSSRIDTSELDTPPTWNFIGLEDGRLFSWDDRLFLCGVRRDCYDDKGTGRMEMQEIEYIDGQWKEVSRNPIPAPGDNSTYCEKNWVPVLDMPYHFVKWTNPTEVVKFDIENGTTETVVLDESKKVPMYRDLRGGTQVLRLNQNQRIAITHEVDLGRDTFGRKDGHYVHRAIIWDNDWTIQHHTQEFHFMGTQTDPVTGNSFHIEFATGMAFIDNRVLISYGLQDNACFVLELPKEVFTEFLMRG